MTNPDAVTILVVKLRYRISDMYLTNLERQKYGCSSMNLQKSILELFQVNANNEKQMLKCTAGKSVKASNERN